MNELFAYTATKHEYNEKCIQDKRNVDWYHSSFIVTLIKLHANLNKTTIILKSKEVFMFFNNIILYFTYTVVMFKLGVY